MVQAEIDTETHAHPGEVTEGCQKCGLCCTQFIIQFKPPERMLELLRKHFNREDLDKIQLKVHHRCAYLDENNRCRIYEERPPICREFLCARAREKMEIIEVNMEDQ